MKTRLAGFHRFDLTDFESLNGKSRWSDENIKKVRNKLEHLKEPLHEKLKNEFGIDFKSNIGGGYPFGKHPIYYIWLSFTQRKEPVLYVPYPQLNVEIRAKELRVFFLLTNKGSVKTGQRIWQKHCNNLKKGLEADDNNNYLIKLIKDQNFIINGDKDIEIEMAIENIEPNGIGVGKEIDKKSVINLQEGVSDEIFRTLKMLYPIYKIAMTSTTK